MDNQMPYVYGPGSMQGSIGSNPRPRPDTSCHCMREIREINRRIENLERRVTRLERRFTGNIIPLRENEDVASNQYSMYSNDNYMI